MTENVFTKNYTELARTCQDLSSLSDTELKELYHRAKNIHTEYNNLQLVVKCNANSLYGVSASKYFSLFDTDCAEDITCTGKHYAILIDKAINNFFINWGDKELSALQTRYPQVRSIKPLTGYVPDNDIDLCVYGDTDSRYLEVYDIMKLIDWSDDEPDLVDFSIWLYDNFISTVIHESIKADCIKRNADPSFLKMQHEVTTNRCIFLKKKKYIMSLAWEDGKRLSKPKIKYKGVEIKKGSMSENAKGILKKLLENYLIEGFSLDEVRRKLLKVLQVLKIKNDVSNIYIISSVSYHPDDYYKDSTGKYVSSKNHIQMQMHLAWLNFIEKNKLHDRFRPAFSGQKMKYYVTLDPEQKIMAVPDDVDFSEIENLPPCDWDTMNYKSIALPLTRYLVNKANISAKDVEVFLLGIKTLDFV